jgi:cytochrome c553
LIQYPVKVLAVTVFATGLVFLLISVGYRMVPESSPVARGAASPGVYSCLDCHGMDDQISPDDRALNCNNRSLEHQHLKYEGRCEDLLAFFASVLVRNTFEKRIRDLNANRLLAGERLARRYYCFQCHGELGQGGFPNKGALKGYVPGFFGSDFRALTNNGSPSGIEAWITRGTNLDLTGRLIEGPIAAFFIERQAIHMPSFDSLSGRELDLLVDYVSVLNRLGPMDVARVMEYERFTRH